MEKPVIKKKKGISPIWILPIVALMIGGWLLYKSYRDAGIDIVVHFPNAEGITVGKTKVVYRGITIGTVRDIVIDPGISSVALHLEMDRNTKGGLVEDTKFWLVKPEVSAGRISGLDTLLLGSYIAAQRGVSKVECREFTGLLEAPPVQSDAPGLHIKLTAKNLGSIQRDTQIYYKNIPIGSVQGYKLNENQEGVIIDAYIELQYKSLIKTRTRFWNSSGINFKGGLSGFQFRMESMAALVYGGISLYTPKYQSQSPVAENGRIYPLYEEFDDAEFGLKMTLQIPTAQGIEADITKVMYHGFEAGVVTNITFDEDKKTITAHINIDPKAEFILREGSRFWIVKAELSVNRVRHLDTLIKGNYIAFEPGDGIYKDYFVLQDAPLTDEIMPAGKTFTLVSDESKSFAIGAPILYRDLKVGEITGFDLDAEGLKIRGEILIYEKYAHLVKTDSVFWKSGGLKFNAGLDGINIESGTMATLLTGGITFTNPDKKRDLQKIAEALKSFTIYNDYQSALDNNPTLQARGLGVQIKATDAKDFSIGSPVLYKHIEVGKVIGFALEKGDNNVLVDIFIDQEYAYLLKSTSLFYNISGITVAGGLSGIELKTGSLKSILAGGISFFTPEPGQPALAGQQYLLYESRKAAQEIDKKLITIRFADSTGLKKGMEVRYQGIVIGTVQEVNFTAAMDAVLGLTMIDNRAAKLFTANTRLWLVSPEVSLAGINNLDTVISGPYITLQPGSGSPVTKITALTKPPVLEPVATGLNIVLEADLLGSLNKNSPIYYRQIQVGRVTGTQLSPTAQKVFIHINITPPYDRLVHNNTKFWNSSGINVKAGIFSGVKISTESLESIVVGGVSMATPEGENMGRRAFSGQHFTLYDEARKTWRTWQPAIALD